LLIKLSKLIQNLPLDFHFISLKRIFKKEGDLFGVNEKLF